MQRKLLTFFGLIELILLFGCAQPKLAITKHTEQFYTVNGNQGKDSLMQAFLSSYKKGVDTIMQEILVYSDVPLTKAQPECTMGNLIADAQLVSAKKIDSSVMSFVAYDKTNEILLVVFNSGSVWMYYDLAIDIYQELISADSTGKYFNLNIRNKYVNECLHKKEMSVG